MNQDNKMTQETTERKQPEINKADTSGELPDKALDKVVGGATAGTNTSKSNIRNAN